MLRVTRKHDYGKATGHEGSGEEKEFYSIVQERCKTGKEKTKESPTGRRPKPAEEQENNKKRKQERKEKKQKKTMARLLREALPLVLLLLRILLFFLLLRL
jgi:molecular chaperone GrpE (heat shock protein)